MPPPLSGARIWCVYWVPWKNSPGAKKPFKDRRVVLFKRDAHFALFVYVTSNAYWRPNSAYRRELRAADSDWIALGLDADSYAHCDDVQKHVIGAFQTNPVGYVRAGYRKMLMRAIEDARRDVANGVIDPPV